MFQILQNETHSVPKFQLNTLRVENAFALTIVVYLSSKGIPINENKF